MSEAPPFPKYVEDFMQTTSQFLSQFKLDLETQEQIRPDARKYVVQAEDGPVELILHRTQRSIGRPTGEYRVRIMAKADPEFCEFALGKEDLLNRAATFGALTPTENSVVCQALVPRIGLETTAGLLAVAVAHARRSLVVSNAKIFSRQDDPPIEQMSAWTDLDLEGLHYDQAHLGTGEIGRRSWRMDFFGAGTLMINSVHNNPYWGGGLLCLLRVQKKSIEDASQITGRHLNMWAHLIGEAPTFGAWLSENHDFVFVQFLPNFVKGLPGLLDIVVSHAFIRSRELPILAHAALESERA